MTLSALETRLKACAGEHLAQGWFPSLAVSVFNREGSLLKFALGDAGEDSVFDLASLTKLATSTLVLNAIEEGKLSLESKANEVLPQVDSDPDLRSFLDQATVFHLLTHTAGLPAWFPFYTAPDFHSALKLAARLPRPQGVEYSDLGFILLGKMLEALYQQPLNAQVKEKLAQPLGLSRFDFLPDANWPLVPSGYGNPSEIAMCREMGLLFDGFGPQEAILARVHDGNAHYAFQGVAGHAGIFSDLDGLEGLARHWLNTPSPLLQSAMQEQTEGRGLGWQTGELYPQGCGHTGFTGTSLYLCPELGVGMALLTNRCYVQGREPRVINPFRKQMHQLMFDWARPMKGGAA